MGNPRKSNGYRRRQVLARIKSSDAPCWICLLPIDNALPAAHPWACEADELIPVSKGGSPYDPSNIRRAHRCCNNWRSAKPCWLVDAIRAKVSQTARYETPDEFVALAKAAQSQSNRAASPAPVHHTTQW